MTTEDDLIYTGPEFEILLQPPVTDTHFRDYFPWCKFESGSTNCINDPCLNENHRHPE